MKKIEHLPINWVNGQKINNTHFFETYYNVVEMLSQNREEELTSYNYGFGEKSEREECSIDMDIKGESAETLSVELRACNAVTRNGYHILFTKELYGDFTPKCTLKDIEIVPIVSIKSTMIDSPQVVDSRLYVSEILETTEDKVRNHKPADSCHRPRCIFQSSANPVEYKIVNPHSDNT